VVMDGTGRPGHDSGRGGCTDKGGSTASHHDWVSL
jgi:hypothetical protein